MSSFFSKIKGSGTTNAALSTKDVASKKTNEPVPDPTPLEKMLQNAGPLREDGSDRFYGFENFGNTCYCNSIVQALFYSDLFRDNVIQYASDPHANGDRPKVNVTIRPPLNPGPPDSAPGKKSALGLNGSKPRPVVATNVLGPGQQVRPEDKPDTPEYKKKHAMLKGPIVELAQENTGAYGMDECTFTGLKDIFLALRESQTRTGVISPQRFLEIFKRDNEMFRNSMHQDAHEFYGLVLNDVIANVEANARKMKQLEDSRKSDGLTQSVETALSSGLANHGGRAETGWVHDIFEGLLTSETRCLTCERSSQRDETFLDLSIDLEEHSSVTSCLRKFSAEEMLCERNKFHCDHCGGLQEAEKRMMVKRLPKILTLHLKRFKYTEDYSRLQKLFHRVVYPYHLRMFNTTDGTEDPDRLYELYAVVVHIGGNAYHGHYVAIIKTKDRGWLLFDDEMVEPVDKHFVRNFFGDKPGMATAYVLFYQETTFEKVRAEQEAEGMEEVKLANQAASVAQADGDKNDLGSPLKRQASQPANSPLHEQEAMASLAHANTAPDMSSPLSVKSPLFPSMAAGLANGTKTKEDKKREKKEREAADKAEKAAEKARKEQAKEQAKLDEKKRKEDMAKSSLARRNEQDEMQKVLEASRKTAEQEELTRQQDGTSTSTGTGTGTGTGTEAEPEGSSNTNSLERPKRDKSLSKKSFSFFSKDKDKGPSENGQNNGDSPGKPDKLMGRLSMSLGRKKSSNMLS